MTDLMQLIADLKKVTVGSRELDGRVAQAFGWIPVGKGWAHWTRPDGRTNTHVPFYTLSLDDALGLHHEDSWMAMLVGAVQNVVVEHAGSGVDAVILELNLLALEKLR